MLVAFVPPSVSTPTLAVSRLLARKLPWIVVLAPALPILTPDAVVPPSVSVPAVIVSRLPDCKPPATLPTPSIQKFALVCNVVAFWIKFAADGVSTLLSQVLRYPVVLRQVIVVPVVVSSVTPNLPLIVVTVFDLPMFTPVAVVVPRLSVAAAAVSRVGVKTFVVPLTVPPVSVLAWPVPLIQKFAPDCTVLFWF